MENKEKYMGINERKREIVESLNQHNGVASINYLCKKLYASRSTIRRDLMALEEDGILKRSQKIWIKNKSLQEKWSR